MATQRKKGYFFTSTNDKSRLLKDDKPKENTFRDLLESIPFFKEASSAATSLIQGLVKKATQAQFDAGTDIDSGESLYATPSQIKAANDALNSSISNLNSLTSSLEERRSRVLYHNSTPSATSGTGVTDLMTYQLPFGVLSLDDFDKLRIQMVVITGANLLDGASQTANAKNLKAYFGTKEIMSVDLGVAVGGNFVKRFTVDWQFTKGTGVNVDYVVTQSYATDIFGSIDVQEINLNSGLALNEDLDDSGNFPLDIKITGEATVAPEIITAELLSIDVIKG